MRKTEQESKFNNLILNLTIFYFLTASSLAVFRGFRFSFTQFALAFFLLLILLARKRVLKDWIPLVLILVSYEFLSGLIPVSGAKVNIYTMPNFDFAVFGNILNIKLQNALFNQYHYHWYDYFSVVLYGAHIIIPVIIGVLFWIKNKNVYRQYILSFTVVSYISFITYILYPAMPPWFASELGFIPNVYEIIGAIASSYNYSMFFSHIYDYGGVNINAAMPSLHASYPFLILLFFAKYKK